MTLQGQSTLTNDEKRTEAKKHLDYLQSFIEQMTPNETKFIEDLTGRFDVFGDKTQISNRQLFWLRDLVLKY